MDRRNNEGGTKSVHAIPSSLDSLQARYTASLPTTVQLSHASRERDQFAGKLLRVGKFKVFCVHLVIVR